MGLFAHRNRTGYSDRHPIFWMPVAIFFAIALFTVAIASRAAVPDLGDVSAARAHPEKPQRIVSLNMCIDQLIIELVDRERISAVSFLAKDKTLTPDTERFDGIATVKGQAEEVLAHEPDLILVGQFTTPTTVQLLKKLGKNVVVIPLAHDFESMRETIAALGKVVGEEARARTMIENFDHRLTAASREAGRRPTALAYQVNSIAAGPYSLLDAVIRKAGYINLARSLPLSPAARLPLEKLVAHPPDLLILANAPGDFRTVLADNLRHPALEKILRSRPSMSLPMPNWMCATPRLVDAVEDLVAMKPEALDHASRVQP